MRLLTIRPMRSAYLRKSHDEPLVWGVRMAISFDAFFYPSFAIKTPFAVRKDRTSN